MWTVRAFMVLAATGLDRAYLYFFNDDDTPHLHASSGLTRNFVPKPAFHAVAHLQKTLGDYRFTRSIRERADGFVYEFTNDAKRRVWVVWKPEEPPAPLTLDIGTQRIAKAERTPLKSGAIESISVTMADGKAVVEATELPLYIWLED